MDASATIVVTGGPDAGKSFPLAEDLVHIGRGRDNQVVLSDQALSEHQASIVRRNGRYAIYAPVAGAVQVEGSDIPSEKWIWLPRSALIRLGAETVVRLESAEPENGSAGPAAHEATPTPTPVKRPRSTPPGQKQETPAKKDPPDRPRRKPKPGEKQPQIARFISDRSGAPLVKLGEDGQLPALELAELAAEQPQERRQKPSSNPLLLYAAIGFSFAASLGMLLIPTNTGRTTSSGSQAAAREALREFYGREGEPLVHYQQLLRQALIKHAQRDAQGEREAYRQVLQMLNAADIRDPQLHPDGLTGKHTRKGRISDERLREALEILLAG